MTIEYRIIEKYYDKDRRWYIVVKKINYGNKFLNWIRGSHWGYINSDGEYVYGGWQNGYTTTSLEDAKGLINYLDKKQ